MTAAQPGIRQMAESGISQPFTAYAKALLALCVFVGMAEGYDVQAMALAAPLVRVAWKLGFGEIGLLMSMSAVGLVLGSFLLSPFGDTRGRRPAILVGMLIASLGTGAGALAAGFAPLVGARLIAGIGLGMAMPNVIAMALEVVPVRMRALSVVLVSCGYPLGAALGATAASALVPTLGHAAVFLIGLCGSAIALLACTIFLPESPAFLSRRPDSADKRDRLVERLGWSPAGNSIDRAASEKEGILSRTAALFTVERRRATILLWLMNLGNVALVYFYFSWLPSIFTGPGIDASAAIRATSLFSASGAIGGLGMALLLSRVGPVRLLLLAYALAIAATATLAYRPGVDLLLYLTLALAGVAIVGSQFCLSAIVAQYYPSAIRATASGFATGIGRAGAVLTPLAVGAIIGAAGASREAFVIALAPAAIALIAALLLELTGSLRVGASTEEV